mmetsp:Transcript_50381/g.133817  ORF Transcript_50381/g.133817 Transcript_50381/m.133817 type:complete len:277 (+) Transcript_50381:150-980(+)
MPSRGWCGLRVSLAHLPNMFGGTPTDCVTWDPRLASGPHHAHRGGASPHLGRTSTRSSRVEEHLFSIVRDRVDASTTHGTVHSAAMHLVSTRSAEAVATGPQHGGHGASLAKAYGALLNCPASRWRIQAHDFLGPGRPAVPGCKPEDILASPDEEAHIVQPAQHGKDVRHQIQRGHDVEQCQEEVELLASCQIHSTPQQQRRAAEREIHATQKSQCGPSHEDEGSTGKSKSLAHLTKEVTRRSQGIESLLLPPAPTSHPLSGRGERGQPLHKPHRE